MRYALSESRRVPCSFQPYDILPPRDQRDTHREDVQNKLEVYEIYMHTVFSGITGMPLYM